MQRKNSSKAMCYLVAVCALVSALAMVGCGGGDDDGNDGGTTATSGQTIPTVNTGAVPVTSSNVQALVGQPLAFQNGSIFDPSLGSTPATLTFTGPGTAPNSEAFNLTSGNSASTGNTTFGSCTFTFTQGSLAGKSVTFQTCTIQITANNVTVGGGSVSGTLTFTLNGNASTITVQVSILANGTLLVNGVSTGIIISSTGTPTTTGTTGTGGQ
jgi:hypothetical protein